MKDKKIIGGPTLEQIQHSLFLETELGNDRIVDFTIEGGHDTSATIEAAKRLEASEWELDCFIPFTDGWHLLAHYSPKTRTGIVLRTWQEKV